MRGGISEIEGGGIWRVTVSQGYGPDGRRRRITRRVHGTRQDAEEALARLLVAVDEGRLTAAPGTVKWLGERWFEFASSGWSANTVPIQRGILRRHIYPTLGDRPLRKLRTSDIDDLYATMRRSGLKPATIRRVHVVLRRMLAQGVTWDLIGFNPAVAASPPPVKAADIEPPSVAQVRKLLTAADELDPDFATFLRLSAATGARRSELCALTWDDLDLERGRVWITKSAITAGSAGQVKETKSGDRRRIPIDTATALRLAGHRRKMEDRAALVDSTPERWVFSSHSRCAVPWHPSSVTHRFARLADKAGVDCRLHDLRHFSVTQMLAAGVPVVDVAKRHGHRRTSTTLDVYGAWIDRDDGAAEIMGRLLDD